MVVYVLTVENPNSFRVEGVFESKESAEKAMLECYCIVLRDRYDRKNIDKLIFENIDLLPTNALSFESIMCECAEKLRDCREMFYESYIYDAEAYVKDNDSYWKWHIEIMEVEK